MYVDSPLVRYTSAARAKRFGNASSNFVSACTYRWKHIKKTYRSQIYFIHSLTDSQRVASILNLLLMTKFGDKTVLHVHVQVTSSFSQPLYYYSNTTYILPKCIPDAFANAKYVTKEPMLYSLFVKNRPYSLSFH